MVRGERPSRKTGSRKTGSTLDLGVKLGVEGTQRFTSDDAMLAANSPTHSQLPTTVGYSSFLRDREFLVLLAWH